MTRLIASPYFELLSAEQQANAIKNVYKVYYNEAAAQVAGQKWSNALAYSKITDVCHLYLVKAYKDGLGDLAASGEEVDMQKELAEFVSSLGVSKDEQKILLYANGYRGKENRNSIIKYILSLDMDEMERMVILAVLNSLRSQNNIASYIDELNMLSLSDDEKERLASMLGIKLSNGRFVPDEDDAK